MEKKDNTDITYYHDTWYDDNTYICCYNCKGYKKSICTTKSSARCTERTYNLEYCFAFEIRSKGVKDRDDIFDDRPFKRDKSLEDKGKEDNTTTEKSTTKHRSKGIANNTNDAWRREEIERSNARWFRSGFGGNRP